MRPALVAFRPQRAPARLSTRAFSPPALPALAGKPSGPFRAVERPAKPESAWRRPAVGRATQGTRVWKQIAGGVNESLRFGHGPCSAARVVPSGHERDFRNAE
jgi:hypothetical protein